MRYRHMEPIDSINSDYDIESDMIDLLVGRMSTIFRLIIYRRGYIRGQMTGQQDPLSLRYKTM